MEGYRYNLPQLFGDVVAQYGDRLAIQFDRGVHVTYRTLDRVSNQMARFLMERGVSMGDRICICTEKTPVHYAMVMGALKVGAAYFSVDSKNPIRRIESIIGQCEPKVIITDTDLNFGSRSNLVVRCGESYEDLPIAAFDEGPVDTERITGSLPAYIMFTSGSTGTPKGAVISHDNLMRFVAWAQEEYGFTAEDRHTHLNPVYFDNSIFDIYSTFFSGGCLIPFGSSILADPSAIVARIEEMECTTWFSVPSLLMYLQVMKEIRPEPLRSLKRIIFGGEGYPKVKLKELYEILGEQTQLINVYGPTECTCICSSYAISEADFADLEGLPPLGQLIPNFQAYLLDGDDETALGESGELCLGGPCVGLGYYNQSKETEGAFVQNPLNTTYVETIYRTGDLARRDPKDGKLYFVGRKDLQIKHQGYRIELEEIQNALVSLDGVDEAAVLYRDDVGQGQIIAVVASTAVLDTKGLKRELAAHVPQYMVPNRIHLVESMPKNANGKTDRKRLKEEYVAS